jgi:hypothetical protein
MTHLLPGLGAPQPQPRPQPVQFAFDPEVEALITEIVAETGYGREFARSQLLAVGQVLEQALASAGGVS